MDAVWCTVGGGVSEPLTLTSLFDSGCVYTNYRRKYMMGVSVVSYRRVMSSRGISRSNV